MIHATFSWNELITHDVERAKAFYAEAVGWEYDRMLMPDGGSYWVAVMGDEAVAGIMQMPANLPAGTPSHWFSYLEVDDVDSRIESVKAAGGTVLREAFDVDGVGRMAVVSDATGAAIGLMTSEHIDDDDFDDDEYDDEDDDDDDAEKGDKR